MEFRKELYCIASAFRKNHNWVSKNICSAIGSRLDGVIRTIKGKSYEFGGIDVAKKWKGISPLNSLVDT